jgi:hypothetical protein
VRIDDIRAVNVTSDNAITKNQPYISVSGMNDEGCDVSLAGNTHLPFRPAEKDNCIRAIPVAYTANSEVIDLSIPNKPLVFGCVLREVVDLSFGTFVEKKQKHTHTQMPLGTGDDERDTSEA